jgi:LPXTG-motif cell wall-anchored protein
VAASGSAAETDSASTGPISAGSTTAENGDSQLARTGAAASAVLPWGGLLCTLGIGCVLVARRRRPGRLSP